MSTAVDLFGNEVATVTRPKIAPRKLDCVQFESTRPSVREPVFSEVTKIYPHYCVTYAKEITGFFSGRDSKMPISNKAGVYISDKGRRRLGAALNWMVLFSRLKTVYSIKEQKSFKFRLSFITLTLPTEQRHTDHYIKKHLLAPFLKWMARNHGAVSYVWKAEVQENSNIHFHVTTNQFIHWKAIRGKWNRLLAKHGYCKVFQDGTNDKGDAATQIKSVKEMGRIVAYLQGYILKKDSMKHSVSRYCPTEGGIYNKENYRQAYCIGEVANEYKRSVHGKTWSTSANLSKINCCISMEDDSSYFEAARSILQDSKIVMQNEYLTIRRHVALKSQGMNPLLLTRLQEVKKRHFSKDIQKARINISSFY